ncbi:MAG TPA: XcyI family restriction endonuclease [Thermomicrobiales bacterium]
MTDRPLLPPRATRQVGFHELLLAARKTWTVDALSDVLAGVDQETVKRQLLEFAPADVLQMLARLGIRDEHVFPTPVVLETKPSLVGYYRLLTGIGQKSFYRGPTGMSPFRKMESEGIPLPATRQLLPDFCAAIGDVLAELVRAISPALSARDIPELQFLTLGSNFYGSANNTIGQVAMKGVLESIAVALAGYPVEKRARSLVVASKDGRTFAVALSNDPDVAVQETTEGHPHNVIAIEVKGGSDAANVYNRGGEAEKSHQGAKATYAQCWTIIRTSGIDFEKLKRGSPTTDAWFDTSQILTHKGHDWDDFVRRIRRVVSGDESAP